MDKTGFVIPPFFRMYTDEKKEPAKESRFLCFLRAPLKYLIKARDFYIKTMTECSGKLDYALALGCPIGQVPTNLPKSYSLSSAKSSRSDEDYSELIRIASARSCGTKSVNMGVHQRQRIRNSPVKGTAGVSRSFSVTIGRIDEEKSCEFGEEVKVKTGVCQRSGIYAVSRSGY